MFHSADFVGKSFHFLLNAKHIVYIVSFQEKVLISLFVEKLSHWRKTKLFH